MSLACGAWFCAIVYLSSAAVSAGNTTSCPTWFHRNYNNECTINCIIGSIRNVGSEMKVEIPDGFCVTYSSQEDEFYGGYCPFKHRESNKSRQFSELPSHPDEVNDAVCGPYHREGLLCGICANGHGPAVYSYDLKCANCSKLSEGNSIILFLFLEFVPGALFFFFVVIFRLS